MKSTWDYKEKMCMDAILLQIEKTLPQIPMEDKLKYLVGRWQQEEQLQDAINSIIHRKE